MGLNKTKCFILYFYCLSLSLQAASRLSKNTNAVINNNIPSCPPLLVVFNFTLNDKRQSPVFNIIMWACLFLGQGVQVCLYCQEWYAQIHCPRTGVCTPPTCILLVLERLKAAMCHDEIYACLINFIISGSFYSLRIALLFYDTRSADSDKTDTIFYSGKKVGQKTCFLSGLIKL